MNPDELQKLAHSVDNMLPENYGLILLVVPFDELGIEKDIGCVTTLSCEDAIIALKEWVQRLEESDYEKFTNRQEPGYN